MNNPPVVDVIVRNLPGTAGFTISVHITFPPGAESAAPVVSVESNPVAEALPLLPPPAIKAKNTFENFIVGPENELAHAAAVAVAADPGQLYNPLLIYGNTGLGKTHLLHAVAHSVMRKNPHARIVYTTCEAFTDEYIQAVRAPGDAEKYPKINDFKRKYRGVDVLLFDDIQFLAGKTGTQEEFFNIINHLQLHHRQVILTCDRPVKEINELFDRLVSRFQGGMTAEVQAPGLETRTAIIERKALARGVTLTREVIEFLATRIVRNVSNLEGAIIRIAGYAGLCGSRELSIARLEELLKDILDE